MNGELAQMDAQGAHAVYVLAAAVVAASLAVLLGHVKQLHLALEALQAQVNVLSSNMTAVDNLAQAVALGTAASEGGALSPEQAAQLLRLAEGSSADACAGGGEEGGASGAAGGGGVVRGFVGLCMLALLLSPTIMLVLYEFKEGMARKGLMEEGLGGKRRRGGEKSAFSWWDQVGYRVDDWLTNTKGTNVGFLMLLTADMVALGALLSYAVSLLSSDAEPGPDLLALIWQTWTFVADPGTHADESGVLERLVALLITLGGMMLFAVMTGIVTDSISTRMEELNAGLSKVMEQRHTLIINWSDKILPTIAQLCNANESEGGGVVVVLADKDKHEMEAEIKALADQARPSFLPLMLFHPLPLTPRTPSPFCVAAVLG